MEGENSFGWNHYMLMNLMNLKNSRFLTLLAFLSIALPISAQRGAFDNIVDETPQSHQDAPSANVEKFALKGYRLGGDSVCVNIEGKLRDFLTGVFFKRLSDNELNLPSRDYKNRYLKCLDCDILHYSVDNLASRLSITDLTLGIPPTIKKANLTMKSKEGHLLSELEVWVAPRVNIFLMWKGAQVAVNDANSLSEVGAEDEVRIVAFAENGAALQVTEHYLWSFAEMADYRFLKGDTLSETEKRKLMENRKATKGIRLKLLGEDGAEWIYNVTLGAEENP